MNDIVEQLLSVFFLRRGNTFFFVGRNVMFEKIIIDENHEHQWSLSTYRVSTFFAIAHLLKIKRTCLHSTLSNGKQHSVYWVWGECYSLQKLVPYGSKKECFLPVCKPRTIYWFRKKMDSYGSMFVFSKKLLFLFLSFSLST